MFATYRKLQLHYSTTLLTQHSIQKCASPFFDYSTQKTNQTFKLRIFANLRKKKKEPIWILWPCFPLCRLLIHFYKTVVLGWHVALSLRYSWICLNVVRVAHEWPCSMSYGSVLTQSNKTASLLAKKLSQRIHIYKKYKYNFF